jgi:hypothetical protein
MAAMARELRKTYHGAKDAVASVYIAPDMKWDEAALEAVLLTILVQILNIGEKSYGAENLLGYAKTLKLERVTEPRIDVIRRALKMGIRSLDRAFLVMDGVDDCGWFTDFSMENDILQLQQVGLKVVLSSRTLCLTSEELGQVRAYCDNCDEEMKRNLKVFWRCDSSHHDTPFIICSTCRESFGKCPKWYVSSQIIVIEFVMPVL